VFQNTWSARGGEMAKATTNYNAFQLILENRPIKPKKLITLKKKMENNPHLFKVKPILCNSKEASKDRYASCDGLGLGIIDGQHRFTVGQQLGRKIYYNVDDNIHLDDVSEATSETTPWSLPDFLHKFCMQGRIQYKAFSGYLSKTGFPISVCQVILQGGRGKYQTIQFQTGDLECKNWKLANNFEEAINGTDDKAGVCDYLGFARKSSFLNAFWLMFKNPLFDINRMMNKLEYGASTVRNCPDKPLFLRELSRLYNYNSRDKVKFYEDE